VTETDGHEAYEDHASEPMADSRDRCAMRGGRLGIEPPLQQPDHVDLQAVIERKVTAGTLPIVWALVRPRTNGVGTIAAGRIGLAVLRREKSRSTPRE
jgi:hypothetical protein